MATENTRNEGYIRVFAIPLSIVVAIMFIIFDLDSIPLPMSEGPLQFERLAVVPSFLALEQRKFAGQLFVALHLSAYLCVCLITLCYKDKPVDTYKKEESLNSIRVIEQLGRLTLKEIAAFIFVSYMIIYAGVLFYMLAGAIVGIPFLLGLNLIEFIFQFETDRDTLFYTAQVLSYLWGVLPCFCAFFLVYSLRAKDKLLIEV